MKLLFVLLLLTGAAFCAEPGSPQHLNELVQFNETFNVFFRDLLGCPAYATDVKDCHPARAVWNQAAWNQLQEQAPRVFPQPSQKRTVRRWWQFWRKRKVTL